MQIRRRRPLACVLPMLCAQVLALALAPAALCYRIGGADASDALDHHGVAHQGTAP